MTYPRCLSIAVVLIALASPVSAQPSAAILISPSADVAGSTITFTWHSAPGATWYQFWLGKAASTLVTEQWYTAEHAGCATGGTCAITLTPPINAGPFTWHIRTWNPSGYGPWSPGHMFTVRDVMQAWSGKLPPSRRFTLVLDGHGVLDNETGLVWQRSVSGGVYQWGEALYACASVVLAGRGGWRVPTLSELRSLFDHAQLNPALPPGHPFTLPASAYFWTQTATTHIASYYYAVALFNGQMTTATNGPAVTFSVWCVRGGASPAQ